MNSVEKCKLEVLTINKDPNDCDSLRAIMGHTNWIFHCVSDLPKAVLFMESSFVPVILCSSELPGATWKDVIEAMRHFPNPPKVLVYSDVADDALWLDVLNSGGYDLLSKPLNADEVVRLVSLAFRTWKHDVRVAKLGQRESHKLSLTAHS